MPIHKKLFSSAGRSEKKKGDRKCCVDRKGPMEMLWSNLDGFGLQMVSATSLIVFNLPPWPSFITDLKRKSEKIRKSPAKALFFPFQYVSFTFSIRFHPLTRFIFVYVIRKKKKEKLYTELVEFPFSLDYTNSNLFNFSLFFSSSSSFHFPFLQPTVSQNTFRTPVYTTSKRRSAMGVGLVFEADLGTTEHVNRWVLQGVCLTLNDDWLTDDVETFSPPSRTLPYDFLLLYFLPFS